MTVWGWVGCGDHGKRESAWQPEPIGQYLDSSTGVSGTEDARGWDTRVGLGIIGWVLYLYRVIWGYCCGKRGWLAEKPGVAGGTDTGGG